MAKAKWMLPLLVGILLLLAAPACGGAEGAGNSTVITPIQRIQNLESGLEGVWAGIAGGAQDYIAILDRVDLIKEEVDLIQEELDALAAQILDILDTLETFSLPNETNNETL